MCAGLTEKRANRAQEAKRKAALKLAKKLYEASEATNDFLLACLDAGEPGRGADDGRVLLIANMTEYACYLETVYGTRTG